MSIDENENTANAGERPESNAEIPLPSPFPELERRLARNWPVEAWRDSHVVLAVSGGADSVALLRAMVALKDHYGGAGKLFTAHLNHGLRGDEADADAAWLSTLCERLSVPLEVTKVDVTSLAAQQGDGWEAAARAARYDFLKQIAERLGARSVATAHTADDQVETVLQRIVRGTGLAGLAGIPMVRPLSGSVVLVRPLLTTERQDVIGYLAALGQDFRTDSSNDDSRYTRNRLRHELLPSLRERFNSDVDGALMRLATQAGEAQQVVESLAATITRDCAVVEFDQVHSEPRRAKRVQIDCGRLVGQPAIVVREVCKVAWHEARWPLQAMGFHEWQLLADLASGECTKKTANLPENTRARRERTVLLLEFGGLP